MAATWSRDDTLLRVGVGDNPSESHMAAVARTRDALQLAKIASPRAPSCSLDIMSR